MQFEEESPKQYVDIARAPDKEMRPDRPVPSGVMRCLHGYGVCLWRFKRFEDAERVFDRMLWLNPSDNQGVRFLIDEVRARAAWENRREERQR